MNTHTIHKVRISQGFEIFTLRNENLEISLVPELGAKIISLVNRRTGREWMWQPEGERKWFRNALGDDFAASTMVGWDECLPTIAPCEFKDRRLPDHGEVWSVPWQLNREACARGQLKTSVRLAVSPLDFERTIALHGNAVELDYRLTNRRDAPEAFLWAMHPLLPVTPGDALDLTAETRQRLGDKPWLENLSFPADQPACDKTFAGPLTMGRAGVGNPQTGDKLTYFWDTRLNNTLGVWLTCGGWNGHHHLALEPTNGGPDSLAAAHAQGRCGVIPANGTLSWKITLLIEPAVTMV